jgi:hypothetical protein
VIEGFSSRSAIDTVVGDCHTRELELDELAGHLGRRPARTPRELVGGRGQEAE